MTRAFAAVVRRVKNCPLDFSAGDRMGFVLPAAIKEESDQLCALAVSDLVPVIQRYDALLEKGKQAEFGEGIFCTGCKKLGGFVEFDVEHVPAGFGEGAGAQDAELHAKVEALKRFPLFAPVPDRSLAHVVSCIREREVKPGKTILRAGDRGHRLYLLAEGEVDVVTTDAQGVDTVVGKLGAGECFGEMSLLTGEPISATIKAKDGAKLQTIDKHDFERLLAQNPALNLYFTRLLATRLRKTSQRFIEEIEKGVLGYLSMIHPPELIQALSLTERSGTLHAKEGEKEISIYLQQGQAFTVEPKGEANPDPEEAFFEFLTWRQGTFRFEPGEVEVERTFFKDITGLLLEGMRRVDEAGAPG